MVFRPELTLKNLHEARSVDEASAKEEELSEVARIRRIRRKRL